MTRMPFGFRIVGSTAKPRRLVVAAAAFAGYASCDPQAEIDQEAYLSAFRFGADFRDYYIARGRSTRGFDGPCWTPFVWFDLDDPADPGRALANARRLVAFLLARFTALDDDALLLFFSGSKGFHVGLPVCWDAPPSPTSHRVTRDFAATLAAGAGVNIDASIYDKVRAFRAPNSTHPKTGLRKRQLALDELNGLTLHGIRRLAERPEPFDVPTPPATCEQAAADWHSAAAAVAREAVGMAERRAAVLSGTPTLNRLTLQFIRDGAEQGHRHRLLFSAAASLAEFNCPPALAHALLTDAAHDIGLSPSDVRRQIECGLAHGSKQTEGNGNV
jgi:hypothetical protein